MTELQYYDKAAKSPLLPIHRLRRSRDIVLLRVIELVKDDDLIRAFVQPYARYIERELRPHLPESAEVVAIHKYTALAKTMQVEIRVGSVSELECTTVGDGLMRMVCRPGCHQMPACDL